MRRNGKSVFISKSLRGNLHTDFNIIYLSLNTFCFQKMPLLLALLSKNDYICARYVAYHAKESRK